MEDPDAAFRVVLDRFQISADDDLVGGPPEAHRETEERVRILRDRGSQFRLVGPRLVHQSKHVGGTRPEAQIVVSRSAHEHHILPDDHRKTEVVSSDRVRCDERLVMIPVVPVASIDVDGPRFADVGVPIGTDREPLALEVESIAEGRAFDGLGRHDPTGRWEIRGDGGSQAGERPDGDDDRATRERVR